MNNHFKAITHLLCKWHITQSLTKNFSFLASMNFGNIRDKILTLPHLEFEEEFETKYMEIKSALESKNFTKPSIISKECIKLRTNGQKLSYLSLLLEECIALQEWNQ